MANNVPTARAPMLRLAAVLIAVGVVFTQNSQAIDYASVAHTVSLGPRARGDRGERPGRDCAPVPNL